MAEHGIQCPLSRSGNVWEFVPETRLRRDSAMESFFSTLETERTAGNVCRSRDAARADVFDYIAGLYHPRRRHSTLGYMSPVDFEERMRLAQLSVHRTGAAHPSCQAFKFPGGGEAR